MQSANLSGPFRGCLYYALLGLPQATGLAGGYDSPPREKAAPTGTLQKTGGGFCFLKILPPNWCKSIDKAPNWCYNTSTVKEGEQTPRNTN
nr:MAG TPA: hypothetical protein [Caudoviricetes sp.]